MTHLNHWSSLLPPVAPDVPLAAKAKLAITSKREMCCKHGNFCPKIVSQFFWMSTSLVPIVSWAVRNHRPKPKDTVPPLYYMTVQAPLCVFTIGPEELSHMVIPLASKGFSYE